MRLIEILSVLRLKECTIPRIGSEAYLNIFSRQISGVGMFKHDIRLPYHNKTGSHGSVLDLLLFSLYINNLRKCALHSNVHICPNDVQLYQSAVPKQMCMWIGQKMIRGTFNSVQH